MRANVDTLEYTMVYATFTCQISSESVYSIDKKRGENFRILPYCQLRNSALALISGAEALSTGAQQTLPIQRCQDRGRKEDEPRLFQ